MDPLEHILSLVGQVALELVFGQPGKDTGLLPVNSLLEQLEQAAAAEGGEPARPAASCARRWVDAALEAGVFDELILRRLDEWCRWFESFGAAVRTGRPVPALPADWDQTPGQTPAEAPARVAAGPAALPADDILVLRLAEDRELLREFTNEAKEHLQSIELGVLALEADPHDADTLNAIFRAFHTFKGGAGFLNLGPIQRLAHDLESLLGKARQHELLIDAGVIELILAGGDALKHYVTQIERQLAGDSEPQPIATATAPLRERIRAVLTKSAGSSGQPVEPERNQPAGLPAAQPGEAEAPVAALSKPPAPATTEAVAPPAPSPSVPARPAAESKSELGAASASVKVDTQKLDALMDLVGEMVVAQSLVAQDPSLAGEASPRLASNLAHLGRITGDLQRTALALRMVPIRATFQKMTRVVRDLAIKAGKQVELRMSGEDTELDRRLIEQIGDPMIHLIRNAVDHGVEKPATRLAHGKPAQGVIWLRAYHQGGNILIEIQDDGAGLDRERILAKAIEQGLTEPGKARSDQEVFEFIFAPGFSTAEQVTEISGRGVGMDVVRRNLDRLRGKIEIQSVPGQGARFSLHLPLTLAIIDGLILGVGGQRFILPTLSVRESFRPRREMVSVIQGRGEVVHVRGHLSPLLRLSEYFGLPAKSDNPCDGLVVVIDWGGDHRALLVDDLICKQEVVIKSLGDTFKPDPALAGAAILGDGQVGLILDVQALARLTPPALQEAA